MGYMLRPGLHFCVVHGRALFLDLPNGRYFALPSRINDTFVLLAAQDSIETNFEHLSALEDLGVILPAEAGGPRIQAARGVGIKVSLFDTDLPRPHIGSVVESVCVQWKISMSVRRSPISAIVARLGARQLGPSSDEPIGEAAIDALSALKRSSYLASGVDRCLVRSLATFGILARRSLPTRIVFGVKRAPFAAHCWLQHETTVLTDSLDEVRLYEPILVV